MKKKWAPAEGALFSSRAKGLVLEHHSCLPPAVECCRDASCGWPSPDVSIMLGSTGKKAILACFVKQDNIHK